MPFRFGYLAVGRGSLVVKGCRGEREEYCKDLFWDLSTSLLEPESELDEPLPELVSRLERELERRRFSPFSTGTVVAWFTALQGSDSSNFKVHGGPSKGSSSFSRACAFMAYGVSVYIHSIPFLGFDSWMCWVWHGEGGSRTHKYPHSPDSVYPWAH